MEEGAAELELQIHSEGKRRTMAGDRTAEKGEKVYTVVTQDILGLFEVRPIGRGGSILHPSPSLPLATTKEITSMALAL